MVLSPKGPSGVDVRSKESFVREIVNTSVVSALHPRSSLSLALQVLEDDGGLLSCLVNSACLALVDCGIAMRCLFAAVSVAVTNEGDILVDSGTLNINFRVLICHLGLVLSI